MRWMAVAVAALVLVVLDLTALHDILLGESDLKAEYATLACSSLGLAGLLAGALARAADRRPARGAADEE